MGETFLSSAPTPSPFPDGDVPTDPNAQLDPRPDGLPEKFADVPALAEAYSQLEQRLGTPAAEPAPTPPVPPIGEAPPAPVEPPADPNAALSVPRTPAAIDFSTFEQEFETTGALTEESYGTLAAQGMSKEMVNQYIAGKLAIGQQQAQTIHGHVGGPQEYQKLMTWASRNLNAEEVTAFETQVLGADPAAAKMAALGLQARFQAATGSQPQLLEGGPAPTHAIGFRSKDEMMRAMQDPRYETDEAYRADVAKQMEGASF